MKKGSWTAFKDYKVIVTLVVLVVVIVLLLFSGIPQVRLSPEQSSLTELGLSPAQNTLLEMINPYIEDNAPFRISIDQGEVGEVEGESVVLLTEAESYLAFHDVTSIPPGFEGATTGAFERKCECSYGDDQALVTCYKEGQKYYAYVNGTIGVDGIAPTPQGFGSKFKIGPVSLKTSKTCQTNAECSGELTKCKGYALQRFLNAETQAKLTSLGCEQVGVEPSPNEKTTEMCNSGVISLG